MSSILKMLSSRFELCSENCFRVWRDPRLTLHRRIYFILLQSTVNVVFKVLQLFTADIKQLFAVESRNQIQSFTILFCGF